MIQTIEHAGREYPLFQASGNAARFILPFAIEVCKGTGFDVGANRKQWSLPHSLVIDPACGDERFDAMNFPELTPDYIFSSHCLEHIPDWAGVLNYWTEKLRVGGVMFLYLPDFSQSYWRSWNNRKHVNNFTPHIVAQYFKDSERYTNLFVSGVDLNNSFAFMAEKVI